MGFQPVGMCAGSGVEQGASNPTPSLKSKLRPLLSFCQTLRPRASHVPPMPQFPRLYQWGEALGTHTFPSGSVSLCLCDVARMPGASHPPGWLR